MSGDIHVVAHNTEPHNTEWDVVIEGTGDRTRYQSQEEAIAFATRLSKWKRVRLLIHGRNDQLLERNIVTAVSTTPDRFTIKAGLHPCNVRENICNFTTSKICNALKFLTKFINSHRE